MGGVFEFYKNLLIELRKMMLDFVIQPKTVQLSDEIERIELQEFKFSDVYIGNEKIDAVYPYAVINFDAGIGAEYYTLGTNPGHNIPVKITMFSKFDPSTEFIEKLRIFSYFNEIFIGSVARTLFAGTVDLITVPPELKLVEHAKAGVSKFTITMTLRKHRIG